MSSKKSWSFCVFLIFAAAVTLSPALAWGGTDSPPVPGQERGFNLDAFQWFTSAWNWVLGTFGVETGAGSLDKATASTAASAEPEGDGGSSNSTEGGGGAGPLIDPDGST